VKIPIRNLYFLLLYAWDVLEEAALLDVAPGDATNILELFARSLNSGIRHLMRKGIRQDYIARQEEVEGVRGRLLCDQTVRRGNLNRGITICETDYLTADVPINQVLRSTVRLLLAMKELDNKLHGELLGTYRRLGGITIMPVSLERIHRIQLHRNTAFYRFLLNTCELIIRGVGVEDEKGGTTFRGFDEAELLHKVFESFAYNFYRREQHEFEVTRDQIRWVSAFGSPEDLNFLPIMRTDVSLSSATRYIIIDTKYYTETLGIRFGKKQIHARHLYQMYAYLSNVRAKCNPSVIVEGILLYPKVTEDVSIAIRINDLPIRVQTVDLTKSGGDIRHQLLSFITSVAK
jgi:5-methylcytosine-specific restriction enzyme subunit McrC